MNRTAGQATNKVRVVVYGASGYTAGELLRLLWQHPQVEIVGVVSNSQAGVALSKMHPHLAAELGQLDTIGADALPSCDCIFFATPPGVAMRKVADILAQGVKVIDLSPDFRIKNVELWQKWYGMQHSETNLLKEAVYGLPEANRLELSKGEGLRLIANPGCYATAVQLSLLPLAANPAYKEVLERNELVVDAKSGVSGAGKQAVERLLLGEAGEDFTCYATSGHRHQPEMEESLNDATGVRMHLKFVPHLLPIARGIFSDVYVPLNIRNISDVDSLRAEYENFYKDHPFVNILPQAVAPRIKSVRGSNFCHIGIYATEGSKYVTVCAVIDNLVKGASGQAIQNMNLAFALGETTGLQQPGLAP